MVQHMRSEIENVAILREAVRATERGEMDAGDG
jgi:hypothetical protein